jgi:hypothetical protein
LFFFINCEKKCFWKQQNLWNYCSACVKQRRRFLLTENFPHTRTCNVCIKLSHCEENNLTSAHCIRTTKTHCFGITTTDSEFYKTTLFQLCFILSEELRIP